MNFDYFLVSPKHKRSCCVGSTRFGYTYFFPKTEKCIAFFKWAMEENIKDIMLVNENEMAQIEEKWEAGELAEEENQDYQLVGKQEDIDRFLQLAQGKKQ